MLPEVIIISVLCIPLAITSSLSISTERTEGNLDLKSEEITSAPSDSVLSHHHDNGMAPEEPQNDLPFPHLRTSEIGIPVGEARDPPLCPPPSLTQSMAICYLQKCSSHHDCSSDDACCFNGCIHTCTEPMDRPAAFDWVEDTSKIRPILDVDFDESPRPFFPIRLRNQTSEYEAAMAGEEVVHLPGGCFVTATRYTKLKEFMKASSIKECRCYEGEVVCDVIAKRS